MADNKNAGTTAFDTQALLWHLTGKHVIGLKTVNNVEGVGVHFKFK
jgi:hypothetical protein